jgi:hypothetical protein
MDENELIEALNTLRVEALRNEQMSSVDALKNIQLAIGYAEELSARIKVLHIRELVEGVINLQKKHSITRPNSSGDIVFFCGSILLQWNNYSEGGKMISQP